jgi:hypothetical protein
VIGGEDFTEAQRAGRTSSIPNTTLINFDFVSSAQLSKLILICLQLMMCLLTVDVIDDAVEIRLTDGEGTTTPFRNSSMVDIELSARWA